MPCARMVAARLEDRCGPESQRYAATPHVASPGRSQEANRLAWQFDSIRMFLVALVLVSKHFLEPLGLHLC